MCAYYDGTKLLSMLDINGKKPEIYLCTTNRTGGKTVWFSRYLVKKFIEKEKKFCLVYRYNYELDNIGDKFFKDIKNLFFTDYYMTSTKKAKGIFHELFLQHGKEIKNCGYAISLNSADQIKKYSHFFSDVDCMLFDEFQSETNRYCPNEIEKLISVHTSIARGNGEQVRYVPIYMLSNAVSIINPYYTALGITSRIQEKTKFLKGDGFVLEQGFIESASQAQKESGFNRAFKDNKYVAYASQNIYLNDNTALIEKPQGASNYIATLVYKNKYYGVREFINDGIVYCDDKADMTFPLKLAITTDDLNINYVMLKRNFILLENLRYYFDKGCFRFKNLTCKDVVLKALSY